jgi:hypothetical protein
MATKDKTTTAIYCKVLDVSFLEFRYSTSKFILAMKPRYTDQSGLKEHLYPFSRPTVEEYLKETHNEDIKRQVNRLIDLCEKKDCSYIRLLDVPESLKN